LGEKFAIFLGAIVFFFFFDSFVIGVIGKTAVTPDTAGGLERTLVTWTYGKAHC